MNLPNKLTILRIILIIPFVLFMILGQGEGWMKWAALAIFVIASLTDTLDGYIARKYHLITDFGKFMDPLADKILVMSAMILLVEFGRLPAWIVIIILAREFAVSGFRLIASDNGLVIAASWWGKVKTVTQMIMVILMIADLPAPYPHIITDIVMYAALALTVISMIDYFVKNAHVLKSQK